MSQIHQAEGADPRLQRARCVVGEPLGTGPSIDTPMAIGRWPWVLGLALRWLPSLTTPVD